MILKAGDKCFELVWFKSVRFAPANKRAYDGLAGYEGYGPFGVTERFHSAIDHLEGTDVYGNQYSQGPYSIKFKDEEFQYFLLSSGDNTIWAIFPRDKFEERKSGIATYIQALNSSKGATGD